MNVRGITLSCLTLGSVLVACGTGDANVSTDGGTGTTSTTTMATGTATDGTGTTTGEPFPPTCSHANLVGPCDGEGQMCGNGTRDTCEICWSSDDGPVTCEDVTETCDGDDLEASCASLGYVSGSVQCSPACTVDVRDCESCADHEQSIGCARPRVDGFDIASLRLASNGDVVAAAWITFDDFLHFARFGSDLALIEERTCEKLDDGLSLALAPSPSGWVLAIGGTGDNPDVVVRRLDAEGNDAGSPRVIANAAHPVLAARPGESPLLVYASTDFAAAFDVPVIAELLDEAGGPSWQSQVKDMAIAEETSAAYVGPGFVVAARARGGEPTSLIPLDAGGTVGTPQAILDAIATELAPAGNGVAASWRAGDSWQLGWFDGDGVATIGSVEATVRDPDVATQEHEVVAVGTKTVFAITESVRTELGVVHADWEGSIVVPRYVLASEPAEVAWLAATAHREDVVLAWVGYSGDPASSRFVLGRLAP